MGLSAILCCCAKRAHARKEGPAPPADGPVDAPPAMARKPTVGLRKPGDTAEAGECPHGNDDFHLNEPQPTPEGSDYLYFGQPGDAALAARTHSGSQQKPARPGGAVGQHATPATAAQSNISAPKDDSGFLNAGLNNQQMGYQNMTYGGSLQYDYSESRPSGS